MRRPRHLSAEERALWDRVADRTDPLKKRPTKAEKPKPKQALSRPEPRQSLPSFTIGEAAPYRADNDLVASISDRLRTAPVRMDAKAHKRMTRGKLAPEARIDLHGMTLAEAHPRLVSFVISAHASGHRLVLVITGKGRRSDEDGPIPVRHGRLRHEVPHWLTSPPLAGIVLQVTEAHRSHGGHGALYVYLSRTR